MWFHNSLNHEDKLRLHLFYVLWQDLLLHICEPFVLYLAILYINSQSHLL